MNECSLLKITYLKRVRNESDQEASKKEDRAN